MWFTDILLLAFRTVRSNPLRTGITVAIIAFGIMALIGIITAIQAMNQKMMESFSAMGANGFSIRHKERNFWIGNERRNVKVSRKKKKEEKTSHFNQPITEKEAETFVNAFQYGTTGISNFGGNRNTVTYQKKKTTPNVYLIGGDQNYLDLNGYQLQWGRNFSPAEIQSSTRVCLLGADVASKLFKEKSSALHKVVRINGIEHRVIGVLDSKGSIFGFSRDNIVIAPYKILKRHFNVNAFTIGIKTDAVHLVENAMGEAEGTFRGIRKLATTEESNFILARSNSLAEKAMNSIRLLTVSVSIIGLITLIGAAIGLMNIMLVAVAERTKEVGLVKAIGGKRHDIRKQFLIEAVLISIAGSVIGIALGVIVGNLFAILLETGFVIPWLWVIYGIVICAVVGLGAGIYPAWKAGRLNAIEALRYE